MCLVFIVASEECFDNCISEDEVQLLQVGSHDGQAFIPGLHTNVHFVGQTLEDAQETAKLGMGQVTDQLTDALDTADFQLKSATKKFNASVHEFYASAKMVDSVAQNLTKLQKLVSDTVEDLIPCYKAALGNVQRAVAAVRTILSTAGQTTEVREILDEWEDVAIEGFTQLADAAEEMGRNVENSASTKVREAVEIMDSKTQQAVEISKDLRAVLDEGMAFFAKSLVPKLSLALGGEELDSAVEKIGGLDRTADRVFGNLEALLNVMNTELPKCGETVDYQQHVGDMAKKKGFWARIFGGRRLFTHRSIRFAFSQPHGCQQVAVPI